MNTKEPDQNSTQGDSFNWDKNDTDESIILYYSQKYGPLPTLLKKELIPLVSDMLQHSVFNPNLNNEYSHPSFIHLISYAVAQEVDLHVLLNLLETGYTCGLKQNEKLYDPTDELKKRFSAIYDLAKQLMSGFMQSASIPVDICNFMVRTNGILYARNINQLQLLIDIEVLGGRDFYCHIELLNRNEEKQQKAGLVTSPVYSSQIVFYGELHGHILIYPEDSRGDIKLTDSQITILRSIGSMLGFLLHHHEEFRQRYNDFIHREEYNSRIRSALSSVIRVLSKVLELRDAYTAGHQENVAKLSVMLGKKIGLSKDKLEGLMFAAQVHDIGKIAIPSEILTKPSKLTSHEYELIKCHPEIGYQLLADYEFPWSVAEIIRQHHERLDGTGYPLGLKGENILIEAKILAVADAFESIMNHRPYRPGLGCEIAIDTLTQHNKEYDQTIVEQLINLIEDNEIGFILPSKKKK